MKPMNDILLEELNNSYVGLLVLDIYRPRGTVIIIELGNKNALFRITIYLAYWAFIKNEEEEVLTCFEPRENRDTYKNCLSHLKGTRMERIWFDDDELNLSFSDAFEFNIIEDDEEYGVGSHVVRFSEHNKTDMLCYSTDREWFISGDDEIVSEDALNYTGFVFDSLIYETTARSHGYKSIPNNRKLFDL